MAELLAAWLPDRPPTVKLYGGHAPDFDDMVALWPLCSFTSPDDAAKQFTVAYPYTPDDAAGQP